MLTTSIWISSVFLPWMQGIYQWLLLEYFALERELSIHFIHYSRAFEDEEEEALNHWKFKFHTIYTRRERANEKSKQEINIIQTNNQKKNKKRSLSMNEWMDIQCMWKFFFQCAHSQNHHHHHIYFFSRLFGYSIRLYHTIGFWSKTFFFVCMFFFYKYIFLIHKRYRKIFRKNQTHRRQIYFVFVCLLLLFVVAVYGILLHWIFVFWENIFSYRILHIDFRYFWYVVIIIIIIIVSSHVSFVVL